MIEETGDLYQEDSLMKEKVNTGLASLGHSLTKFVALNKRVSYGKWKLEEMIQATENWVTDVLHIDKVVFEEQKPQHCCQDSSDLQSLVELLKQKPNIFTEHSEKVNLWVCCETVGQLKKLYSSFSVPKRHVSSTIELKKVKWNPFRPT